MKEMNREMELSMDELEQVTGGDSFCIGWGISLDDDLAGAEACFVPGASTNTAGGDFGFGATACFMGVFGVGVGGTCS